ncbi:MAG TPA: S8 family serine peptidase, partial [Parasegetibacter sp.]
LLQFCFTTLFAQEGKYIIRFTDKAGTPYSLSNPSAYLSERAIERRNRQKIPVDSSDLPITPRYLDSLRAAGAEILNVSKWFNQALVRITDEVILDKINSFPFVIASQRLSPQVMSVQSTGQSQTKSKWDDIETEGKTLPNNSTRVQSDITDYGNSYNQIHIHEGEFLHNQGFKGNGIVIAVLDAGFNSYKSNPALDSIRMKGRILGEWDFVKNEASVNEDHAHGMYCLSAMAANRPGVMVGSAPHASYWLLRTEDAASEYPIEEQNWVAAAEFADSAGADMISSSLGYVSFDDPSYNYSYAQRDGNTSLITRGADKAAQKGILVMISAGNYGTRTDDVKYVACPADGDSVMAVGSVNISGIISGFSSWGPNGAGKVKPSVVSVGQGTVLANAAGNTFASNGTSYSNPNLAGLIACLWQAFPEFNNMEIMRAVERSAHQFSHPDDRYGHGIPNFRKAYEILQAEKELRANSQILGNDHIKAYPLPFTDNLKVLLKGRINGTVLLRLLDGHGRIIETKSLTTVTDLYYNISFTRTFSLNSGVYYIQYDDGLNRTMTPVIRQ